MSIENDFKGKRVLVTGAGKGIGRALTHQLHEYGATVYALSRGEETLASLKAECPSIITVCVDLIDWDKTQEAVSSIGAVDAVLNVAGVGLEEPFLEITSKVFDEIINVNVKSVVNVSQVASKAMILAGKGGSIVNISSRMARRAFPGCAIYSASKAAVDMLTKSMALELGPHNIRVNSINLGGVWTPMWADSFQEGGTGRADLEAFKARVLPRIPAGNLFVPMQDVVHTVLFAASGLTSMLTGENIALDGGYCVT